MYNILFPLIAGVVFLVAPVRPDPNKSDQDTAERVAKRKKLLRVIGALMLVIAAAQLFIKLAQGGQDGPASASAAVESSAQTSAAPGR